MRLLIINPWAGLPERQRIYIQLERRTGWEIALLTPVSWSDEYGGVVTPERHSELKGELFSIPVGLSGNIPLHFFARSIESVLDEFRPDCIYVYHEPYALATFQCVRANKRWQSVPIGVRSSQNLLKRYPWPIRRLEKSVYDAADFAIVVSESVA